MLSSLLGWCCRHCWGSVLMLLTDSVVISGGLELPSSVDSVVIASGLALSSLVGWSVIVGGWCCRLWWVSGLPLLV